MNDALRHLTLAELEHLLQQAEETGLGVPAWEAQPIEAADRSGPLALSFAQQRLWFLAQMDPHSLAYHMCGGLVLRGALDRAALRRALDGIVARHEALRTVIGLQDGQPVQRIRPADTGFTLQEHDLRGQDAAQAQVQALADEEAGTPFDLAQGPLIRGRLITVDEQEQVLLVTMHHIVSDGWSMGVLTRELSVLYRAFVQGQDDPLQPLAIQYADYAAWQRQWLQGEELQRQGAYWQQRLAGAPALLELPTDRPRQAPQDPRGAALEIELDEALSAGLKALGQRHGSTLYMTLLAAWAVLLGRLSGQQDLVIGTPVANRRRLEVEGLIGFFINTLALRVDLGGSPGTGELLQRVKAQALDAQDHQDLPFEQVVELVKPARSLLHSPVFQVMFAWQNNAEAELELAGLQVQPMAPRHDIAKFDLMLNLGEAGGRIAGELEYATALFDRGTIERHIACFKTLLQAMVADEAQPVDRLELLGAAERQQLLVAWNATDAQYPRELCLHQLVQAQAARTPQAVAVVHGPQCLSYAELNTQANRLAHHLRRLGVGPDRRVALCVQRSERMVVALLAVLKAGGAYVPLDPAYPPQRLAYMLADSAPAVLLADGPVPLDSASLTMPVLDLQADAAAWAGQPGHDPEPGELHPGHLAYLIYTSGSTGQPKGVAIEHGNAVNFISWAQREFSTAELQRTLLSTSLNFDLAVYECWVPLCSGTTVEVVADALALNRQPQAQPTLVNTVPSAIAALLEARAVPASVHTINLAGEPLKRALADQLFAHTGVQRLCNLYGPSETTTYSTWVAMPREQGFVPHIGRPIANTRIYLLDPHGQPVPIGVAGELHIGGAGVARGYLNRPELTAERFVDDPFHGGRMYRTGDLARYLPDGNIEYLGRNDFQVKIRGYRIELGEIEARLQEQPGVREAVVLAREDSPGDKRLVAYYTVQAGAEPPEAQALRHALAGRLPEYMVPAACVHLEHLPLTPNGKLDRKALPAPDAQAHAVRGYEAPQGEIETVLAQAWSELLRVERVGRHDDFFALGGHSLLAVGLVSRLRTALGVELPLRQLFAQPVLRDLAEALRAAQRSELPPIEEADRSQPLALSFAQQRLWFLAQEERHRAAYHLPLSLRLTGALDRVALRWSLDRLVARHEALRTTFLRQQGQATVRLLPADCGFALQEQDLRADPQARATAARLAADEAAARFDLEAGPLIRGRLLQLADQEHLLLVTQHHIVTDGWSMGVLCSELAALYAAALDGRADPLPALPLQYPDYAAWQRGWLSGERLARQAGFWRQALQGAPALLELPTDRPRPPQQGFAGAFLPIEIDAGLTAALKALGREQGATLFATVLAAWAVVLARLSGQDDLVIGTGTAQRTRVELEGLIGFFINPLALRIDLSGAPGTRALLQRVQAAALAAQEFQDLPFEQVVEAVQPLRSMAHSPLFQVMFAWQNNEQRQFELPGLQVQDAGTASGTVRFDLDLSLGEADGRIVGGLSYATALFDAATARRHVGYLLAALRALAAADQPVTRIDLLDAAERRQLLLDWNATDAHVPADRCIHELFEAQARRAPQAVALIQDELQLSYAGLNEQANRLAHFLRDLGVGPDTRVAICAGRGPRLVVGLLGILKAGGAYVPLDPAYPPERLAYLLADSDPAVVLVDAAGGRALGDGVHVPCVALDDDAPWADAPATNLPRQETGLDPQHLAYVIYTSGSTGRPKGVMATHQGLVNLALAQGAEFGVTPASRVLQFASPSFDACAFELVMAFVPGAALVLLPASARWTGESLAGYLARHRVSHATLPPALLAALPLNAQLDALGTLIVAGEAPNPMAVAAWARGRRVFNAYGPTETTVWTSVHRCANRPVDNVPIGRPIINTRLYLLDEAGEPVPTGAAGELYIGGTSVTRGYLDRPALTAERFVPDPFGPVPGARLYRTGDLARYLADGSLLFLGRNDHQVKLRGFRIELGEVEARLSEHPAVRDAVVVARTDQGDKRLVAYVTPRPDAAPLLHRLLCLEQAEPSPVHARPELHELPNGLPVFHQNRRETEFLYSEIFDSQEYLQHGIRLDAGSCIFDVGANIGMFSLFMARRYPGARIFGFEPIAALHRCAELNRRLHAIGGRSFNLGLSDRNGSATFRFYPRNTAASTSVVPVQETREIVRAYLHNAAAAGAGADPANPGGLAVDEILDTHLAYEEQECRLRRLSDVMRDLERDMTRDDGVARIDLLKIDVEGAELSVLQGIDAADWPRIGQLVIEVHDVQGRRAAIEELLASHGYQVRRHQNPLLRDTGLYTLHAVHPLHRRPVRETAGDAGTEAGADAGAAVEPWPTRARLVADLRARLSRVLPDYAVPAAFVAVAELPLTPNGKLDRKALPAPDGSSLLQPRHEPPAGPVETTLAGLWGELLEVPQVGRQDRFFELGGHSLLALQLITRIQRDLAVDVSLAQLFEHSSLAELAQVIGAAQAAASPQQAAAAAAIPLVPRDQPLALSSGQQRLWFQAQLDRHNPAYHASLGLHLDGRLDRAALRRALDRIVARHEALRTSFALHDGQPVQCIAPPDTGFLLHEHDLCGLADEPAQAQARSLAAAEALASFDLETGPLIRGRLLVLGEQQHMLLITMHHIVSDGWSLRVFTDELGALYRAFAEGRGDPLAPLPLQYADHAAWQRQRLAGGELARQSDYWRQQLAGAPALLALPADRPRPARQDYRGAMLEIGFDAPLCAGLRALSQRAGATLYMTLMAAWAALLGRLAAQDEVVVGTPVANRTRAEIEGLIGFFINTLPLRVDLGGSPGALELVQRVKATVLAAHQHQDLPFDQMVELVNPARSQAHTQLFQVAFTWHGDMQRALELPGLQLRPATPHHGTAKFDLSLHLWEAGDRIGGAIEYATALFDAATIERHAGYLARLLQAMAAQEAGALDSVDLLGERERQQLLVEWNATQADYPRELCVHELVEAQAAQAPGLPAVAQGGRQLAYAELNAQANRLAWHLRTLGVGPDRPVALCLPRSVEMVVAMLAVLKAGGAYVPLDPGYPAQRLAHMLHDSRAAVLLALGALPAGPDLQRDAPGCVVLDLQRDAPAWNGQPAHDLPRAATGVRAGHLAYVIYTSGSTGQPKGVAVEHRSLHNLVAWHVRAFGLAPARRSASTAGVGFDACTWEVWPPLCSAGTLVLAPAGLERDPGALLRWWQDERLDLSFLVTPLAELAFSEDRINPGLQLLLLGGDRLRRVPGLRAGLGLVNNYGPTEAAVVATSGRLAAGEPVPHIGRPIANTQVYLLDARRRPVPTGVPGELYIGGDGVARGYLNQPQLTAERFMDDPFHSGRMYRTGDLARWRSDGNIEFLGRNDHQVKVRGFRIEPGEIEAQLMQQPGVRDAVVLAREDQPGETRLVAYCVAAEQAAAATPAAALDTAALHERLAALLPDYMLPSAYVQLVHWPLTPNGKLDRQALPAPEGAAPDVPAHEPPAGELETALARIWIDVLGLPRVGRHDDFFDLGGHSLLAVKVASRIRRMLGVKVDVVDLFAARSLAAQARLVHQAAASDMPSITPARRDEPLALSFAQQRLWFLTQMHGPSPTYHLPLGLRLAGRLDGRALQRALARLVARHEALRTCFVPHNPPVQCILPADAGFDLEEHDLRGRADAEAELQRLADAEAQAAFDLETGPLVRGRLIVLGDTDHVLLLTLHHIVSDGWSLGVLTQELGLLYRAFVQGRDDPLPPLAIQYADYAAWQRRWLEGAELQRQGAYWQQRLAGAPALLELPGDRPRPAYQDHAGALLPLEIDAALTAGLKALSRRHGTTLYMTLMAGWAALLGRLSRQDDLVIGTPVANRTRLEIEGLIGFFVNTLALRLDLGGAPGAADLLQRVKSEVLNAQQHQDLPFEQVVDLLRPVRSLSHSPLFQVMFSWQNDEPAAPDLPGLQLQALAPRHDIAKFDLMLSLGEDGSRIVGGIEYATALFDRGTVERFAAGLRLLLQGMVADDRQAIDRLPLLPVQAREQLLVAWNATARDYPRELGVHQLFEARARAQPQAVAVVQGDEALGYGALNERANRLAHRLLAQGVQPGERVALLLERSIDLVAAQLAVLKCGAAYVPLDEHAPASRQAGVLQDCAARLVLGTRRLPLPQAPGVVGLELDTLDLRGQPGHDPVLPAGHANPRETPGGTPAYVMYTSGSTGTPKGVVVPHRAISRVVLNNGYAQFEAGDRVAFAASPAFDASTLEVWAALLNGGRVVVIDQATLLDPQALCQALQQHGVNVLWLTVGLFNQYAQALAPVLPRLRYLIVGGDALDAAVVRRVLADSPPQQLINGYGPTESTVFALTHAVHEVPAGAHSVPIGRPIANTRAYLLDAGGQPVPVGVAGEIHIAGDGLALGYLNRPELTAERFVADPFHGGRMYRTGDLGRYRSDGTIEFLGRNDHQVKLRGYRIELGEIEARLQQQPGVREAVVLAREDSPGDKRLVAYYTAAGTPGADPEEPPALRAALEGELPGYMLPAAFVRLERFPLTASGKVDRKALPAPDAQAHACQAYQAPEGELEAALAQLWSELLQVERISRHDDFFALGGHSLLAVRLASRLRKTMGVHVAVRELFENSSFTALADLLLDARLASYTPADLADGVAQL
jgi:amino acid adenylation domain-containing protein/FkbM family methyltransferase